MTTVNNLTQAYISALTGASDTILDWRVINDTTTGEAINIRGSYQELQQQLEFHNSLGFGIFININEMDGQGVKYENVRSIRTLAVDIDDILVAQESYNRAVNSVNPPHFAVQTSQGKFHLYWLIEPTADKEWFRLMQRKLAVMFNGDKSVSDPTRILRVPGFNHCKGTPTMVNCWSIALDKPRYNQTSIEQWLAEVDATALNGVRNELGKPELQAPSLDWLIKALNMVDPNSLQYGEWLSTSAAFKQAGWTLAPEEQLKDIWLEWCSKYQGNDIRENDLKWWSLKDTQVGWSRFKYLTNIEAYMSFGESTSVPVATQQAVTTPATTATVTTADDVQDLILDAHGKKTWFKDCYFVEREGRIFSNTGRFMNATQFNGRYGGKEFTLRPAGGKLTDEPWKAALRASDWQIPKVDHVRFLPQAKSFEILEDSMGRRGLNTYIPAKIPQVQGDVTIWLFYLSMIFNTTDDVQIFNDYVAHCIKYPGHKIPWSVLLQSTKGIGKQMISDIIKRCIGEAYTYQPDAEELVSGVSQFNGWMRNKIMILVDEVRVGDKYDLMNGLKTIITDRRIAIESKGVDQEMEDNVSNWMFFSNFKDAFPIDENERRYCVFFSSLQTARHLEEKGLTKNFFDKMYHWLEMEQGYEKLAYFYMNYDIAKGSLPHRAPRTSSYDEVIRIGRSPARVILDDKIETKEKGFRGGFVSFTAFQKAIVDSSNIRHTPQDHILRSIIEGKGYEELGYTSKPIVGEDLNKPSLIFGLRGLRVEDYEKCQM